MITKQVAKKEDFKDYIIFELYQVGMWKSKRCDTWISYFDDDTYIGSTHWSGNNYVSVIIPTQQRGKGYLEKIYDMLEHDILKVQIHIDNPRSLRAHLKIGFEKVNERNGQITLIRK